MLGTVTWYLTRASGVVAYVLLTTSVVFGLVLSTRLHGARPSRPWVLDVHRMIGGLAVVFTGAHLASLLLDSYVSFDIVDVLLPFASGWNPLAVAAGVIAVWMLAAVELTSLARSRISNQVWRRVHLLSFGAFVLASLHFAAAGTDAASPVAIVGLLGVVSTVVMLLGYRLAPLVTPGAPQPQRRGPVPRAQPPGASRAPATPPPPPPRRRIPAAQS